MTKRIIAIAFIFVCTAVAWAILGGTIFSRTYDSGAVSSNRVASTWGTSQNQSPPAASFTEEIARQEQALENSKIVTKTVKDKVVHELPLESSRIHVNLDLQHRQKGLLWYSTYKVDFSGVYAFVNQSDKEQLVEFKLLFPTTQAIYDNFTFNVDGNPVAVSNQNNAAMTVVKIGAGKTAKLAVGYSSQGLNEWRYSFGSTEVAQVRDFSLRMRTNFKDIDFPDNTLSPSEKTQTANGWDLNWTYKNLLSGYQIAMVMPEKLQPGPLAGRISFFAPVSLFFFFFLMLIITTMRGIDLHPMNYFFLAAGLPGGSRVNSCVLCNCRGGVGVSGRELFAVGGRDPVREQRGGAGAVYLPGDVLVRVFPQGIHRAGDHDRIGFDIVCGHADHRSHTLGGKVYGQAG
jgi:hypothetical protein